MVGRVGIEDLTADELLAKISGDSVEKTILDDPYILGLLGEKHPSTPQHIVVESNIKSQFYLDNPSDDQGLSECPPVTDTFSPEDDLDSGFYRQLIEDEMQNRKFAQIRKSLDIAIQCSAKEAAQKIDQYVNSNWNITAASQRKAFLMDCLMNMGRMIFELTEKGEVEFLAKTWERRGGTSYEDEEEEKKISLLTLNLGGEENAIFVKKTRAITKKYMYRAMKQALEQLVKDFELNEADNMLI